jgi:hypothetical protein
MSIYTIPFDSRENTKDSFKNILHNNKLISKHLKQQQQQQKREIEREKYYFFFFFFLFQIIRAEHKTKSQTRRN